ncbi:MAG: ArnT family glycosyltransferase [Candidatus Binatia bacterium]
MKEERYYLPFLFLFSILLYLPFLGSRDLWAPVEPRYGEIARVMFAKGEWIVPTVNGDLYTDKPILYFWLVLAFSHLAGGVGEWTLRLPSALSSVGLVMATYFLGKECFDRRVGFFAALILATTARAVWEGRWAHTDMLFTFLFTCSIYFFFRLWRGEEGRRGAFLAYFFMGLAVLAKGFIGVVLPGLILGLFLTFTGTITELRRFRVGLGIAIVLLVVSSWFAPVTLATQGRWLSEFIWTHHVQRYLAGAGHEEPFYYYFVNFPADFLPWTLFLVPAALACWPRRRMLTQPVPLFLAIWFLVVFGFFSLSDTKRGLYLLPLYPAAALFAAHFIVGLEKGEGGGVRTLTVIGIVFFVVLLVASVSLPFVALQFRPELFRPAIPFALVNILGALLVVGSLKKKDFSSASLWIATVILAGILCSSGWILPVIDHYKSPRVFAAEVKQRVAPGEPLYIYEDRMNDFNFYLEREVIPVLSTPDELAEIAARRSRAYVLMRENDLNRARADSPSVWEIVVKGATGSEEWVLLRPTRGG